MADFEKGVAEMVSQVKTQEIVVPPETNPVIADASELLADTPVETKLQEAAEIVGRPPTEAEVTTKDKKTKEPPKPTLADDEEVSIDEFLES